MFGSYYLINEEFAIVKADHREFAVHYTTYGENIFFRQSWERRVAIVEENDPCYWITLREQRIGGICIEPNSLSFFFLEPPFTDINQVLLKLKQLLIQYSNLNEPIRVYGILPYQTEHFLRLGFLPTETRRVMIRPTEIFESQDVGDEFIVELPTLEHLDKMAHSCFNAYSGADSIGYPEKNTLEQQKQDLEYYFTHNKEEILRASSSIVFDESNGNIIAVCLVSLWEDLPLISNISVIPQYRGKQIATKLLKKALTVLFEEYDVVRLFVTAGNPAESLYFNLGFHPGMEQTTFHLPYRNR
ncbi:GNAT family N-acetyltransferase [Lederbergia lenta]|uniref:Ribosomal-protein-alanine acetyltransferase n=1 Tax=Lederbergia lenta TaxID=1467 RepID=A0A2X4YY81_LEDLE|nr:GNAT family N-acetyltransferase [Lederbergia lenta]MEC2326064.1 GNAT family N-acetyltransferase [Lederbergia lenta]SQI53294.1 ribosomal-protein-alanine acetyltransferase [Lederbergia lenta]